MIEAFGGKGYRATTPAELTAALTEALASGGPALIDCVIDPTGRHRERPHRPPQPAKASVGTTMKPHTASNTAHPRHEKEPT